MPGLANVAGLSLWLPTACPELPNCLCALMVAETPLPWADRSRARMNLVAAACSCFPSNQRSLSALSFAAFSMSLCCLSVTFAR